jgi:hypothetical protein
MLCLRLISLPKSLVRGLTEPQAAAVLAYIEQLVGSNRLCARDLMRLPPEVRDGILAAQAAVTESIYGENPELIWDDAEQPMDHA